MAEIGGRPVDTLVFSIIVGPLIGGIAIVLFYFVM